MTKNLINRYDPPVGLLLPIKEDPQNLVKAEY
jgi:hypothetical protein